MPISLLDYTKCLQDIENNCSLNGEAEYLLGECYRLGKGGVLQDYKKAVEWYKKAQAKDYVLLVNPQITCRRTDCGLYCDELKVLFCCGGLNNGPAVVCDRNTALKDCHSFSPYIILWTMLPLTIVTFNFGFFLGVCEEDRYYTIGRKELPFPPPVIDAEPSALVFAPLAQGHDVLTPDVSKQIDFSI